MIIHDINGCSDANDIATKSEIAINNINSKSKCADINMMHSYGTIDSNSFVIWIDSKSFVIWSLDRRYYTTKYKGL